MIAAAVPLAAETSLEGRVDSVYRHYASAETPGCVVGVAQRGRMLLERAYGLADLHRGRGTHAGDPGSPRTRA